MGEHVEHETKMQISINQAFPACGKSRGASILHNLKTCTSLLLKKEYKRLVRAGGELFFEAHANLDT